MGDALEGIRVIDWSVYQVMPYATAMLADLGAEVIHLEEREHGDLLRGMRSFYGVDATMRGRQVNFEEHNRNKKSLAVDLKKAKGREVVYRLVEKSDVFATNFRRKAALALGMDYQTLSRYNPRLIYASASGFGLKGPDSEVASLDLVAQARGGAMLSGGEEGWPPAPGIPNAGDRTTSILLAYGIVTALLHRERSGQGQELHVAQLGAVINLQGFWLMPLLTLGKPLARHNRTRTSNPLYNYYQCQEGRWIILGCIGDWYWAPFCQAIERPELQRDPEFSTEEDRAKNSAKLISIIDRVLAERSREEWMQRFKEADLICSPINALSDLQQDPQVIENDFIVSWEHPILGKIGFPGFPVQFSRTPAQLRKIAPELGEDTEAILTDLCGYSWEEVEMLKKEQVIP